MITVMLYMTKQTMKVFPAKYNIQHNAALAITGVIRGTSQTKLYNELGLQSLKFRR